MAASFILSIFSILPTTFERYQAVAIEMPLMLCVGPD
jgi:hypothetical protein